jgi:hypothetical protein
MIWKTIFPFFIMGVWQGVAMDSLKYYVCVKVGSPAGRTACGRLLPLDTPHCTSMWHAQGGTEVWDQMTYSCRGSAVCRFQSIAVLSFHAIQKTPLPIHLDPQVVVTCRRRLGGPCTYILLLWIKTSVQTEWDWREWQRNYRKQLVISWAKVRWTPVRGRMKMPFFQIQIKKNFFKRNKRRENELAFVNKGSF